MQCGLLLTWLLISDSACSLERMQRLQQRCKANPRAYRAKARFEWRGQTRFTVAMWTRIVWCPVVKRLILNNWMFLLSTSIRFYVLLLCCLSFPTVFLRIDLFFELLAVVGDHNSSLVHKSLGHAWALHYRIGLDFIIRITLMCWLPSLMGHTPCYYYYVFLFTSNF